RMEQLSDMANGQTYTSNGYQDNNNESDRVPELRRISSASNFYDWEAVKNRYKKFHSDPNVNYFWRAHTITCLVLFCATLLYLSVFETSSFDTEYNTKRGLLAVILFFLLYGVIYTPDGPFLRPHPAFWRFILCLSVVYELGLIFLLFQNASDARHMLSYLDPELGKPLPEKDYGGSCLIYDPANTTDPFHNVWDKMDGFVTMHFIGWWLKALILRNYWMCNAISLLFEVLEYSLEHQLPNFSECWWDHWIMDFLLCNGLGIIIGMKTCNYLSLKPYYWTPMWNIPSYSGKLKRMVLQFTPYRWTEFDWSPTKSLKRWLLVLLLIAMFLLAELNTFYLKWVLWLPPPHPLCMARLVFILCMGATAIREIFQYTDDSSCKKFGRQAWLLTAIIVTEALICVKFDWPTVSKPPPTRIIVIWSVIISLTIGWTLWHFCLKQLIFAGQAELKDQQAADAVAAAPKSRTNRRRKDD
ncbi:hypothetical protein BOX15_Mlig025942g2, partial [Macrostomum lignano]